jgi:hypothetical protein
MDESEQKPFSEEEVLQLLRESLKIKLDEKKKYPTRVQLQKALISAMGEFLVAYRVVGFDYEGQLVSFSCHRDPMGKAALDNAFIEEFSKFMARRSAGQST